MNILKNSKTKNLFSFPTVCYFFVFNKPPAFVLVSLPKREALQVTKRILLTNISFGSSGAWKLSAAIGFPMFSFLLLFVCDWRLSIKGPQRAPTLNWNRRGLCAWSAPLIVWRKLGWFWQALSFGGGGGEFWCVVTLVSRGGWEKLVNVLGYWRSFGWIKVFRCKFI